MKIFEDGECWSHSINFVDVNNVLVGFDYSQSCCESFGYKLENSSNVEIDLNEKELEPYIFDTTFFEEHDDGEREYDEGGSVKFKLQNPNTKDEIYLTLYNSHNGYYSHGFSMSVGGKNIYGGSI